MSQWTPDLSDRFQTQILAHDLIKSVQERSEPLLRSHPVCSCPFVTNNLLFIGGSGSTHVRQPQGIEITVKFLGSKAKCQLGLTVFKMELFFISQSDLSFPRWTPSCG